MTAADFLPPRLTLPALRRAAQTCQGCELYKHATQTVFGEGRPHARMLMVGEQPGDREDLTGKPFVGPAGRLLDESLEAAGVDRDEVYVTNAVKHFKWTAAGKRRLHKKPGAREIAACRPWLEAEIEVIQPELIVCLGATAAQALLGREFRITRQRGEILSTEWSRWTMATYHPSAVLRAPDRDVRVRMQEEFIGDLKAAAQRLELSAAAR
jgi:uracil-DNA glycosylase